MLAISHNISHNTLAGPPGPLTKTPWTTSLHAGSEGTFRAQKKEGLPRPPHDDASRSQEHKHFYSRSADLRQASAEAPQAGVSSAPPPFFSYACSDLHNCPAGALLDANNTMRVRQTLKQFLTESA